MLSTGPDFEWFVHSTWPKRFLPAVHMTNLRTVPPRRTSQKTARNTSTLLGYLNTGRTTSSITIATIAMNAMTNDPIIWKIVRIFIPSAVLAFASALKNQRTSGNFPLKNFKWFENFERERCIVRHTSLKFCFLGIGLRLFPLGYEPLAYAQLRQRLLLRRLWIC